MDTMLNREELGMVEEMALNLANMSNHDDILKNGDNVSCKLSFIMSLLGCVVTHDFNLWSIPVKDSPLNCFVYIDISVSIWQENLIKERHHVLIFSQTRKMLNLVQVCSNPCAGFEVFN
ncbi:hypothetical protein HPP92_000110 [Vanilla planifolia]|uniref:Uncharacterized protein n=1 Tax=Vanilla planifolia TaxID=51239 RepID=A0A835RZZ6_VANPL|nr:hypothetical protein HPP92_000110 [Vanilla planifolia]